MHGRVIGRTLWPATADQNPVVAWLNGKTWTDPEVPEVSWSYYVTDGQLIVARAGTSQTNSVPIDYGFGSGKHGVTFVALQPGDVPGLGPAGLEHRLSYAAANRSMVVTPGQEKRKGDRLAAHDVQEGRHLGPERASNVSNATPR